MATKTTKTDTVVSRPPRVPLIHANFIACTNYVRERLGEANVSGFNLEISASGRTLTDRNEIKIEYHLADNSYGGNAVVGNSLEAVTDELLRRHGWTNAHKPLALPGNGEEC